MRITIYYDSGLNVKLDKAFNKMLKPLGFDMVGSGMNLMNGERDLEFTEKEKRLKNDKIRSNKNVKGNSTKRSRS
jgi:hypothetical protein